MLRFMRQGFYWLHLETDSVVARAEKEELLLKLSKGVSAHVTGKRVVCFSSRHWSNRTRVGACGNSRVLPALSRHTSTHVNLYSWPTSAGHTVVTVSLAAGACGNPVYGGTCNAILGRCSLHKRSRFDGVCNATPGVGVDYWRGLFEAVTKHLPSAKPVRPSAVVLSYGLHFPYCSDAARYEHHVDFWLSSLQVLYGGPIVWRSVSPPQFDARLHAHAPTGCSSAPNVTRLGAAVRRTLRAHGVALVNTAPVVAGWANATPDTIHYDGGVLRQWHARNDALRTQPVSGLLLNALLAQLERPALSVAPHRAKAHTGGDEAVV